MDTKEKLDMALNLLATVDFSSNSKRIKNSNSKKVHKAYDIIFSARDDLIYNSKKLRGNK